MTPSVALAARECDGISERNGKEGRAEARPRICISVHTYAFGAKDDVVSIATYGALMR